MTAEEFAAELAPNLKNRGYKKRRLTWVKKYPDITILFWLQKSQFSKDVWYYNYCVGFNEFYSHEITSYNYCDIIQRFDQMYDNRLLTCSDIIAILDVWESKYSDLQNIRMLARADSLPVFTTLRAKSFLLNGKQEGFS